MLIGSAAAIVGLLNRFRSAGSDWSGLIKGMAKSHCSLSGKISRTDQQPYDVLALASTQLTVEEEDPLVRPSADMA